MRIIVLAIVLLMAVPSFAAGFTNDEPLSEKDMSTKLKECREHAMQFVTTDHDLAVRVAGCNTVAAHRRSDCVKEAVRSVCYAAAERALEEKIIELHNKVRDLEGKHPKTMM